MAHGFHGWGRIHTELYWLTKNHKIESEKICIDLGNLCAGS